MDDKRDWYILALDESELNAVSSLVACAFFSVLAETAACSAAATATDKVVLF